MGLFICWYSTCIFLLRSPPLTNTLSYHSDPIVDAQPHHILRRSLCFNTVVHTYLCPYSSCSVPTDGASEKKTRLLPHVANRSALKLQWHQNRQRHCEEWACFTRGVLGFFCIVFLLCATVFLCVACATNGGYHTMVKSNSHGGLMVWAGNSLYSVSIVFLDLPVSP